MTGTEQTFKVIVVGAGLAGLAAAVKLERAGITDFVVLEKGDRVGGTWRDNTYPGNSFLGLAESQLDYVVDALHTLEHKGIEAFEVGDEPFRKFNADVRESLSHTVFDNGGCSSYYLDAQGGNFSAWPWSTGRLRRDLSHFDIENYSVSTYDVGTTAPTSATKGSTLR